MKKSDCLTRVSVIIPIYNEAAIMMANIKRLKEYLDSLDCEYEIILAEDGSRDRSPVIAKRLVSENIKLITSPVKLGRGTSLTNAIRKSNGEIVIYMDADLATDLNFTEKLIDEIRHGADISTGSRLLPESTVRGRTFFRELCSRGYNMMLGFMFSTSLKDHQCGFKAFRKRAVLPLLEKIEDRHWFWDTEILIKAQAAGLTVTEIPISWTDREKSKVKLSSDILDMGLKAMLLRLRI